MRGGLNASRAFFLFEDIIMTKSPKRTSAQPTDPLAIPDFLRRVETRSAEEIAAWREAQRIPAAPIMPKLAVVREGDWNLPKGIKNDPVAQAMIAAKEVIAETKTAEGKERLRALPKTKTAKTPRASRDGLVSVQDIAASVEMTAKGARAALRAAKEPKPAHGWAFASADVERIKAIIVKFKGKSAPAGERKAASAKKAAVKIPPGVAVWTGKAKTKNGNAPPKEPKKVDPNKEPIRAFKKRDAEQTARVNKLHTKLVKRAAKKAARKKS